MFAIKLVFFTEQFDQCSLFQRDDQAVLHDDESDSNQHPFRVSTGQEYNTYIDKGVAAIQGIARMCKWPRGHQSRRFDVACPCCTTGVGDFSYADDFFHQHQDQTGNEILCIRFGGNQQQNQKGDRCVTS